MLSLLWACVAVVFFFLSWLFFVAVLFAGLITLRRWRVIKSTEEFVKNPVSTEWEDAQSLCFGFMKLLDIGFTERLHQVYRVLGFPWRTPLTDTDLISIMLNSSFGLGFRRSEGGKCLSKQVMLLQNGIQRRLVFRIYPDSEITYPKCGPSSIEESRINGRLEVELEGVLLNRSFENVRLMFDMVIQTAHYKEHHLWWEELGRQVGLGKLAEVQRVLGWNPFLIASRACYFGGIEKDAGLIFDIETLNEYAKTEDLTAIADNGLWLSRCVPELIEELKKVFSKYNLDIPADTFVYSVALHALDHWYSNHTLFYKHIPFPETFFGMMRPWRLFVYAYRGVTTPARQEIEALVQRYPLLWQGYEPQVLS